MGAPRYETEMVWRQEKNPKNPRRFRLLDLGYTVLSFGVLGFQALGLQAYMAQLDPTNPCRVLAIIWAFSFALNPKFRA